MSKDSFSQSIGGLSQTSSSSAQGGAYDCKVRYTYDVSGNRIRRVYSCLTEEEMQLPIFRGNIYPNPTDGPVTIDFNELVTTASLLIYDADGSVVGNAETEMAYSIQFDVAEYVPGTYIVMLSVLRENGEPAAEEYTLIKLW